MTLLFDQPAVFRRPDGVVRVTGPDRVSYLHTLLSQHVEGARPGTAADFLYLDAKGNSLAAGRVVVRAEDVLLATPSAALAGELAESLEKFKFLMQVESVDVSEAWAVASVRGEGAPAPGAPSRPMTGAPHGPGIVVRDRSGGSDLIGPRDWVTARLDELGLPEASAAQWDAWRIAAGVPAWGSEIAPGRRAQELGLLPTHVHLRKGCYPGQESIAKIYNLGRPRRALAVVAFDGPVEPGTTVRVDGKSGEVTSAARLGEETVALVLVPVGPDGAFLADEVEVDGATGRIRQRVAEGLAQPGA